MFVDQLFGEAIIRLRGDRSQRLVAKRSGIAPGTLSGWERGRRLPRKSQIFRLLKGLDCTEEDIVATMWRIQGERLVMVGSEAPRSLKARRVLNSIAAARAASGIARTTTSW